ncbi:Endolytic peptidoglycan transglycosylase RlpA [subsurface metagenome]
MKLLIIWIYLLCCALALSSQEGLASWYGGKFQGRRTANGEIFDTNKLTAAHKTLPFGTLVKVTNLTNGKSTMVRINDRGPFVEGRIIDLSRAAAAAIGMAGRGVVRVRIEAYEGLSPKKVYSLQLGAYRDEKNARRIMKGLEEDGFKPVLERTPSGINRVFIKDIQEVSLEHTREKLKALGFKDFLIRLERSDVTTPGTQDSLPR